MNLVRFENPYRTVNRNLVDDLFSNLLRNDYDENYQNECNCKPATNILEKKDTFKIELQLPGYKKEDVQLNYHENFLTVKAEFPEKNEEENKQEEEYKFERREFGVYNFERKFRVPKTVDGEKIEAHFENGILELLLPKKEEALEKAPVDIKIK
jgi:HSP20 family protein